MAIEINDPSRLKKAAVFGGDGKKLGTVSAVYYDNDTDQPEWIAVRTGLFGLDVSLVPLAAAQLQGEELHVPFDKERLKAAPHHDPGLELSPQDEMDLFSHYGLPYGARNTSAAAGTDRDVDHSTADDAAMTRSEQRLRVRTESQAVERVRLRKHIVTEYQQVTVPVRREEIRLERDPVDEPYRGAGVEIDPAAGGAVGDALAGQVVDEEHVIVLHEERPVVRTETVAVERVRLGKQTVTEHQRVAGEVRKEQIELDTDTDVDPGGEVHR